MKSKQIIIFSLILLTLPMIVGTTLAQTAVAGVTKGEIFDYNYNLAWTSTDQAATPPAIYVQINQTQSIQLKITDVSGSRINIDTVKNYKNGTQDTQSGFINIDTGDIEVSYGNLIISANLNANDKMYPSGGHAVIKDTAMRTYSTGQRETNHYIDESTSQESYQKTEIFFDKAKGVAVNYYSEDRETSDGITTMVIETLTNTNADVWTAASAPTPTATGISPTPTTARTPTATVAAFVFSAVDWLIVIAVIIIVLILIILAWYRRRRKPKTQQTQTTYLGTF
jgi:asparagine N-glycosylation enzyme membrane subunit Stt3